MPEFIWHNILLSKKILILNILFTCFLSIQAQNLVPDSSFEINSFIPTDFSQIKASAFWRMASWGTSDLFCKCRDKRKNLSLVNTPQNPMGFQYPHSGSCYAGFFAHSHGQYREYIQTPLIAPLEKNKRYCLKMHISLANYSRVAIDQLGACFLPTKAAYDNSNVIDDLKPVYAKGDDGVMKDTAAWNPLTLIYKANGGEQYLLIGSFLINKIIKTKMKAPKELRTRINQVAERDAYYYIDDISLVELPYDSLQVRMDSILNSVTELTAKVVSDTDFVFRSILFESESAVLQLETYPELDVLIDYLIKNSSIVIEIFGHTDNTGNEKHNQILSEKRAKSISDYLIKKHVHKSRIICKGFGSSNPITTNATKEGRELNRRVEFRIKK